MTVNDTITGSRCSSKDTPNGVRTNMCGPPIAVCVFNEPPTLQVPLSYYVIIVHHHVTSQGKPHSQLFCFVQSYTSLRLPLPAIGHAQSVTIAGREREVEGVVDLGPVTTGGATALHGQGGKSVSLLVHRGERCPL